MGILAFPLLAQAQTNCGNCWAGVTQWHGTWSLTLTGTGLTFAQPGHTAGSKCCRFDGAGVESRGGIRMRRVRVVFSEPDVTADDLILAVALRLSYDLVVTPAERYSLAVIGLLRMAGLRLVNVSLTSH